MTRKSLSVVLAGGGTAGHIEPAMAVADALTHLDPSNRVTALGTERGLEKDLVPARGYDLRMIEAVPLPRHLTKELFRVPGRLHTSVKQARDVMDDVAADVLIGFGGYVSMSAYLAARKGSRHIPYIVHEANARAGIANKIGARHACRVLGAVPGCGFPIDVVGIPVRPTISQLDRSALRAEAREFFGLDPQAPVLLEFGGSQGAQSLNRVMNEAVSGLAEKNIGVLQAVGPKNYDCGDPTRGGAPAGAKDLSLPSGITARNVAPDNAPAQIQVPYINTMNLAYAAADCVICRSGAMTVAEISAVGLPALYVPLPIGNGEQALNAQPVIEAGGGTLINDHDLTGQQVIDWAENLLTTPGKYQTAVAGALRSGSRNAAEDVARAACDLVGYSLPASQH